MVLPVSDKTEYKLDDEHWQMLHLPKIIQQEKI